MQQTTGISGILQKMMKLHKHKELEIEIE